MDHFYVTCPSNSSMTLFPDNTLAQFTVQLNNPIELVGEYEVGLAEIQYPISWHNVRKGKNSFILRQRKLDASATPGRRGKSFYEIKRIPPGYYSVAELIAKMKRLCTAKKMEELGIDITYDASSRHVTVSAKEGEKARGSIKLRHDIARVLGFNGDTMIKSNSIQKSPFAALPSAGFHNMYVYSDIVQPQIVGDSQAPLLRVLPVEDRGERETFVAKTFHKIYYAPILKKRINKIYFQILDDMAQPVGFYYGKIVIVLHFRRKNL